MTEPADAERWRRLTELFDGLVGMPAGDRAARLAELDGEDASLRAEIESLLAESDGAGLLDAPASDVLATFLEEIDETVPEQPVGTRIGAYRLVEELGRGGMGVVYLAERVDGQFEQKVALKLVKRGLDTDEVLARFRRERQILARLDHRSIARLFDGGATEDGRPYFAMEYVMGDPITTWCDARRLSIEERLRLFRRACEAVHHAHRNLVVHRDLKPSNILVTEEGDLKLLDFGVAKLLGSGAEDGQATPTLTRVGLRAMTPEYAAPEQVLGNPVSTATDVYALGVVLYELLTGRRPYRLGPRFGREAERTILEGEPERPSAVVEAPSELERHSAAELAQARGLSPGGLRRRLVGDLDAIVLTALRKEPERRYGSAQSLAEDLGRHLIGDPVAARPEGWLYRAARFAGRHRAALAIVGTLLVLAVAGAFVERGRRTQRREIATQHLARGMELAAEGDALGALPWLTRALELEPDVREREAHRLRIGTLLEYAPRLAQQWSHAGPVIMARFSPDGARVVTASEDRTARVWSVASGEPVTPPLEHGARVTSAEFSPDGREVLTAALDGRARLWDATTGVLVRSLSVDDRRGVAFAAFSPDGRRILTGGSEGEGARLWNRHTGALVAAFPKADRGTFNPRFDRKGRRFVTASSVEAQVWDAETGAPVGPPLRNPVRIGGNGATLSPDGSTVLIQAFDNLCATVWDAVTGAQVVKLCREMAVEEAFFDARGRHVFVFDSSSARLWDLTTARWSERAFDHPTQFSFSRPSRGGEHLLSASQDAGFAWEVGGTRRIGPLRHAAPVRWVDLDSSGRYLATASDDGTARLWDLAGLTANLPARREGLAGRGAAFSPDGTKVLVALTDRTEWSRGGTQQLWDTFTREPILPPLRHGGSIEYYGSLPELFSPDGRRIASGGTDRKLRVWSAETGEPLLTLELDEEITWVAFGSDGERIASGGRARAPASAAADSGEGIAHLFSAETGEPVGAPMTDLEQPLRVTFSRDGRHMATCGDGWVRLWDAANGSLLVPPWRTGGQEWACTFSPDSRWLATGGPGARGVHLWDALTGALVNGPFGDANALFEFSRSGDRVVTGGPPIRVWSVEGSRSLTRPLELDGDPANVEFSPDGRWVLGSGAAPRVWDAASGALLAVLPATAGPWFGGLFLPASDGVLLWEFKGDGRGWTWRFVRDERPVEELIELSSLLAGYRVVSAQSGPVPLTAEELLRLWGLQKQRAGGPALPLERVLAWHQHRGEELAAEGRHAEALARFDAVVEEGPPRATVFEWRGHARAELGRLEEAERDFLRAAELRPGFPDLWSHAALVRRVHGDEVGQVQICSELLRDSGTTQNPDRAYWIARTCALVPDGAAVDRERPLRLADLALPLSGLEAEILDLRGASLYRAGRHEEARERLLAAVESRDGGATSWEGAFLAMVHARLGDRRAASQWLERGASAPLRPSPGSNGEERPWKDRFEAEALLAEARALLGVEPAGTASEARP